MYSYITAFVILAIGCTLVLWFTLNRKSPKHRHPINESKRTIIPKDKHPVSDDHINENARQVISRLNSEGYEAYLVGGCIRDIYLGIQPKDFDIATNARPEEVHKLFRNSRLVGRRFKLVHVLFGREMIEVATFRANHQQHHNKDKSLHSHSGRILRDNVYGTMEDDAMRRDFTINALYYDWHNSNIVDFFNSVDDIHTGTLRLIGDHITRYHEDPVRMLRAIRFTAKLGLNMALETEQPIRSLGHLLSDIPAARLFDETLKLLQCGHGVRAFELLRQYQLFGYLFPATEHYLKKNDHNAYHLIINALKSTDARVMQNRPVTPAFLYAALLWVPMRRKAKELIDNQVPPTQAMQHASRTVIENQSGHTAIPRRFTVMVRDIWDLQSRLEHRQPNQIESILQHSKFRAAYDFLLLRQQFSTRLSIAAQWWTEIQELNKADQQNRIKLLPQKKQRNKRRKRRRKPSANNKSYPDQGGDTQ